MIAALLGRFGLAAAWPARPALIAAAVALALAGLGAWRAAAVIDARIAAAATAARAERDAHWRAEIAAANADAAEARAAQVTAAIAIDAATRETIDDLTRKLTELEAANAALPEVRGCGLGRARVRLLRR